MTSTGRPTLPNDPLHPDHEMFQRVLQGVQRTGEWPSEQAKNLAAALYADIRTRQPHLMASDIGQVAKSAPNASNSVIFATVVRGYHTHDPDPAAYRFSATASAAERPAEQTLGPYRRAISIDENGYLSDPSITHAPVPNITQAPMAQVNGIVLHRTDSSTARGTLEHWRGSASKVGAHFLIDRDGSILQTVSVNHQAWHVGPIRSRGEVEGSITDEDQRQVLGVRGARSEWNGSAARDVGRLEATRPYPERYPINGDSIGIEVVGKYDGKSQEWEAPTPEQKRAVGHLVRTLQNNFGLNDDDVYQHDVISRKTAGEGGGLYTPEQPSDSPDTPSLSSSPLRIR